MNEPELGETIGIRRNIDELGRIVIPKEIRKALELQEGSLVEIFATRDGIFIRKVK